MNNDMDLMQRLAVSKKIMDRHNEIKRGDARQTTPIVEDYQPIEAKYNLPQEFLSENTSQNYHDPSLPLDKNKILNSKLPDEIKKLMIDQPIVQPSSINGGVALSEELIQGAQRLINKDKQNTQKPTPQKHVDNNINVNTTKSDINEIKTIIRDVVRDTVRDVVKEELKRTGLITESSTNTNEVIQFKVGDTLFVGRITKVKKLQK